MGASLRFWWGGRGHRRRQVHEQGLAACGAWGDAALPRWGKGRCGDAGATLFAPLGQRRCCVARLILAGLRGKVRCGAVYLSGGAGRRAGGRGEWRRRAFAGDGTRLHPGKAFRVIHPWRTRRSPPSARGENRPSALPASATFPQPSRGENGGLCPHPPKGPALGDPFLGNAPVVSPPPSPKTPQAAGPCSWACRRLFLPSPQPERNAERPPPARGAGVRRPRANGYWPSALPTTRGSWLRRRNQPCGRLRG